jgi:hypothetical protein
VQRGSDAVVVRGRTIVYASYPQHVETQEETWLARVGGRERRIGRQEDPLGWTSAGLLLLQRGRNIIVRDSRGRHVRTLHVRQALFRPGRRTMLALLRDGSLVRTDGRSWTALTRIVDRRYTLSDVVRGGLIVLVRTGAVLVLDRHGRRYASATFAKRADMGGPLTPLPDGSVAFSVLRVRTHDTVDSVLLVHRGAHTPVRMFTRRLPLSCGHWTNLTYRAGRLLYSSQGRIALIDPAQRRAPVDLTPFARRLAGRAGDASADWS